MRQKGEENKRRRSGEKIGREDHRRAERKRRMEDKKYMFKVTVIIWCAGFFC